jgi:hypothetical protein
MVTFRNFLGEMIAEILEQSTSKQAEEFAKQWNKTATSENRIVEIDMNNGCLIFLNKKF